METTKSKRVARSVLGTPTGDAQHFTVRPTRKEKEEEEEEEDDDDDEKEEEEEENEKISWRLEIGNRLAIGSD